MSTLHNAGLAAVLTLLTACGGGGGGDSSQPTQLSTVELSNIQLEADLSQPLLVNHRIPYSFQVQGFSENPNLEEDIGIGFYFEEKNPLDAEAPRGCDVNAVGLTIQGNGQPELVDEFFLWPVSECIELAEEGVELSLKVRAFRGEERLSEAELVVSDQLPDLRLALGEPDVEYQLETESSVAILPVKNDLEPTLSAKSIFVLHGQDPYYAFIDADSIPADLKQDDPSLDEPSIEEDLTYGFDIEEVKQFTKLPSNLTLTYTIAPAIVPEDKFPLTFALEDESLSIEDLANTNVTNKVTQLEISEINLGVEDTFSHDLFVEGAAADALGFGGEYERENLFLVEGCITMAFPQESNDDFSGQNNDCFTTEIVLERELDVETVDQPDLEYSEDLSRNPGNKRIGIKSTFSTINKLTADGAVAGVKGAVSVQGKIGRSFKQELAGITVEASLNTSDEDDNDSNRNDSDKKKPSSVQVQVRAVGQIVFSLFEENADPEKDQIETARPRFDKNQLIGSLGFGVGPVNFGFQANVGGRVENSVDIAIEGNPDNTNSDCETKFNDIDVIMDGCGTISKRAAPEFGLQAVIFGGLNIRIIRVGVDATLNLMNISFPLDSQLHVGKSVNGAFLVKADIGWDTQLVLIKGDVKLVASIRLVFRRRGFSVTLVSFSSRPIGIDLLDVSTGTLRLAN